MASFEGGFPGSVGGVEKKGIWEKKGEVVGLRKRTMMLPGWRSEWMKLSITSMCYT